MTSIPEILKGDRLAISRLLTEIENGTSEGKRTLNDLFPHTGKAHIVGITGAPGTGKSTLVNRLAYEYRHPSKDHPPLTVAVVAVDPTSPFSGGAVLGDRIRMRDVAGDPGIFIRSMASRGSLGGLAQTTAGLVQVFDAAGFEVILVETVGAGQAEVDIADLAHTTLVLEAPGMGDDVQTIKAGILEIADILVVNKFDRPGAKNTLRLLKNMLRQFDAEERNRLHHGQRTPFPDLPLPESEKNKACWDPPIMTTVATSGEGVSELMEGITKHRNFLLSSKQWTRKEGQRIKREVDTMLQQELLTRWRDSTSSTLYQRTLSKLIKREISPQRAVRLLLEGDQ
jgi:LAO/AO transport system kinase